MTDVYRGDNGVVVTLNVKDKGEVVNITGATVTVTIKKGTAVQAEKVQKTATHIDSANGVCQIVLLDTDLDVEGVYLFQLTVLFPNGNKFSSNTNKITVNPLI